MKLNREKGALYVQVKNILRDRILHGVYPLHSHFPSEPELAEEFKISRITVRNAVKELVTEGFLETKSGKRTKVIRNELIAGRVKGKRFTELLTERGHNIEKRWLSSSELDLDKALKDSDVKLQSDKNIRADSKIDIQLLGELQELLGSTCSRIDRLYLLDNKPYIYFTHYLAADIPLDGLKQNDSLYEWIKAQAVTLMKFQDQFAAELAYGEVAEQLQLQAGEPILKRLRLSYNDSGQLMEYSIGYYNTAIGNYHVDYM